MESKDGLNHIGRRSRRCCLIASSMYNCATETVCQRFEFCKLTQVLKTMESTQSSQNEIQVDHVSIWEPAQKVEIWRSSWTVAQVLLPFPRTWSSTFSGLFGGQDFFTPSYITASGHQLPVFGTKVLLVVLDNGEVMSVTFAVMNVTAPLAAVSRMVKASHTVVFSHELSFVQTAKGRVTPSH